MEGGELIALLSRRTPWYGRFNVDVEAFKGRIVKGGGGSELSHWKEREGGTRCGFPSR